jgi:geranylgeranylglycerol-phosphate geranylgeranyltransferase
MVGFAVIIGEIMVHKTIFMAPTVLGFITGFSITGASMASNDYWDRLVDGVNSPNRPLPSGRVRLKEAITLTIILSTIGLAVSFLTNSALTLSVASLGLVMFLLYNYRLKQLGLIGNLVVSASISLPLVYGGIMVPVQTQSIYRYYVLCFFEAMIFIANTGREINKGITDVEGDKLRGISTIAVKHGTKAAALLSGSLYIAAVAISPLPWFLGQVSWPYLPLVVIADAGLVISAFMIFRDYSRENALKVKKMVLRWMMIGLISFVAGAL